jgi:hypothetical protein
VRELDDPHFPAAARPEALAGCDFLDRLREGIGPQ